MSKYNRFKELYLSENNVIDKDEISINDQTYLKKLEKDISLIKGYKIQVNNGVESLKGQIIEEHNTKKRIIALYQTLGIIPYMPGKDEVIPIAYTSQHLNNRVKVMEKVLSDKTTYINEEQVKRQSSNKVLYEQIIDMINKINNRVENKFDVIQSKVDEIDRSQEFNINEVKDNVEGMKKEADEINKAINSHLKRILTKQIALANIENNETMDQLELKEQLKESVQLIKKLISSEPSNWVEVNSTSNMSLLKVLTLNNLLSARSDSTSDRYLVKLRNFNVIDPN
ncbi:uncharacterized protein RJT21DRAFT_112193 [Scheffersomyces amazonensis]|uniref:uncharacterized protein n=1 Tax=Scheffersomyces amazonensis TaxID=1078765 RepID=UPI00315CDA10